MTSRSRWEDPDARLSGRARAVPVDPARHRIGPWERIGFVNFRRSAAVAAAVLLTGGVLTSCGFGAPTTQVYTPAVGVNDQDGSVDVLNAVVVTAADGSGTLIATLVNNDLAHDDSLTTVTAPEGLEVTVPAPVTVGAGGLVNLADDGSLRIDGASVVAGAVVTVTFDFARSASATLDVPVVEKSADGPYSEVPVAS